jgi:hypothetical protein
MARSDFPSRDAYIQDLRRKVAVGDVHAAERLQQEERRNDPMGAALARWEEDRDVDSLATYLHLRDPYGDIVEEYLPEDIDASELSDLITALSDENYEGTYGGAVFNMAEALYQYCTEWHGGQSSTLYGICSQLGFNPGPMWHNCYGNDAAFLIYMNLNEQRKPTAPQPLDLPDDLVILHGTSNNEAHIIQLGAYACSYFLVIDSSFEDALDWVSGWCSENAPGLLEEPEYELDDDGNCIHCGKNPSNDVCEHVQEAEADLTCCDSGLWIASGEWWGNEVDYDRAKATELSRANLTDEANLPTWGPLWRCGGEWELLPVSEHTFEDVAEELDCELNDLDIEWAWYLLGNENLGFETEVFTYSGAVNEALERYQVD